MSFQIKYDEAFLSKIVPVIEKNISNPEFNGSILSRETGMSKRAIYAKLKKITGQTVNQFIRTIRLKKSIVLLLEEPLDIIQISIETGFNSHSYFTRSFKKYTGISPMEFRAKHKMETTLSSTFLIFN